MAAMKTLLSANLCLAATAALVVQGDSLTFRVEAKSKLTKTFTGHVEIASESMSITVDGNEMPPGATPTVKIADDETIQVTDEYLAVEDGRPTKIRRQFVELGGTEVQTVSMPEGSGMEDREEKKEKASPLDGKTVVFTWKDDAYEAAWAEGEKGEDDLLEKLEGDMDLLAFLPKKAVSEGDSWELEAKAFNLISSPGGRLQLRDKTKEKEEVDGHEEIEKNMSGEGKATFKGTRDVDGTKVGVLAITADLESQGTFEQDGGETEFEYKVTYEGEVLWDVAAGRLVSLELNGKLEVSLEMKRSMEINGESHDMVQKIEFAGTIEHKATVE